MSEGEPNLEGCIAVVTGASRGFGFQSALGLAKAGAHVIAIGRTTGGLEELDDDIKDAGGSATLVPLDLTDLPAIDRLGASIHERWGKLDCLFGNAAMLGPVTPLPHMKPDVFERIMTLNVTANYRLIRSLDPLLRLSDAGRALFVSSGASRSCRAYVGPYAASKAALEAMVASYAREVEKTSIRVNLLDPGTMRTNMRAQYAPGEDPQTVTPPEALVGDVIRMLSPSETNHGGLFSYPEQKWL